MSTDTVPLNAPKRRPPPKGGSRKGIPNKTTAQLKEMILQALDKAGGVDYLVRQAKKKNAAPFMMLLAKVLPMQLTGEDGAAIRIEAIKLVPMEPVKRDGGS